MRNIIVRLSLKADGFVSGLRRAGNAFQGFVRAIPRGIGIVSVAITGLQSAINLVVGGMRLLKNTAEGLFDAFVRPALAAEQWRLGMTTLMGSMEGVLALEDQLTDMSLRYGLSLNDLRDSSKQLSFALQSTFGEVNTDQLMKVLDLQARIMAARPDIIGGAQAVSRGIAAAMSGDFTTLTRLLDLPINKIREMLGITEEANQAMGQQLGSVTALGEGAADALGDPIDTLEKILDAAGITSEFLEETSKSAATDIDRLRAAWDRLKQVAGEAFLPSLADGLERVLEVFSTHRDDLEQFAGILGRLAGQTFDNLIDFLFKQNWKQIAQSIRDTGAAIIEFIGSEETKETVRDIAEAIKEIANTSLDNLETFFQDTDWVEISDAMNSVARSIVIISSVFGNLREGKRDIASQAGRDLNENLLDGYQFGRGALEALGVSPDVIESIYGSESGGRGGRSGRGGKGRSGGFDSEGEDGGSVLDQQDKQVAAQKDRDRENVVVEIKWKDGADDLLEASAKKAANETVGGLVDSITKD